MTHYLADIPSPPQGVWHVGPIAVRAYAVFIIIGIIVAVIWGGRRYVARGGRPGRIADLAVWGVPFGLVGGRLYHVITDHELYFGAGKNPWKAFAIWEGGLGIWGAIALGGLGFWLGCRHYKIPMAPVADALAPAIVVAQAIGRLGNYFNQELFGGHTTLPWALDVYVRTEGGVPFAGTAADAAALTNCEFPTEFIKATPAVLCGAGTYHPTFLYELVWNLLVAAVILWADRRFRLGGGRVFALYVAGYTAGRAWIEALRIDPARTHIFGLRVNIVVSIVVFLLAVCYLIWRRKAGREDPAVVAGPDRAARRDDDDGDAAGVGGDGAAATEDDDPAGVAGAGDTDPGDGGVAASDEASDGNDLATPVDDQDADGSDDDAPAADQSGADPADRDEPSTAAPTSGEAGPGTSPERRIGD